MVKRERTEAPTTEYGPSWWDVSSATLELEQAFACRVEFRVHCPMPNGPNREWSSWSVIAYLIRRGDREPSGPTQAAYWGKGGAWKTAPAAFHHAVTMLYTKLARMEGEAARQTDLFAPGAE